MVREDVEGEGEGCRSRRAAGPRVTGPLEELGSQTQAERLWGRGGERARVPDLRRDKSSGDGWLYNVNALKATELHT